MNTKITGIKIVVALDDETEQVLDVNLEESFMVALWQAERNGKNVADAFRTLAEIGSLVKHRHPEFQTHLMNKIGPWDPNDRSKGA